MRKSAANGGSAQTGHLQTSATASFETEVPTSTGQYCVPRGLGRGLHSHPVSLLQMSNFVANTPSDLTGHTSTGLAGPFSRNHRNETPSPKMLGLALLRNSLGGSSSSLVFQVSMMASQKTLLTKSILRSNASRSKPGSPTATGLKAELHTSALTHQDFASEAQPVILLYRGPPTSSAPRINQKIAPPPPHPTVDQPEMIVILLVGIGLPRHLDVDQLWCGPRTSTQ